MHGQPWAVSGAWALQGLGQVGQPDILPQALGTVVALSRGPGPSRVRRRTGKGSLAVSLTLPERQPPRQPPTRAPTAVRPLHHQGEAEGRSAELVGPLHGQGEGLREVRPAPAVTASEVWPGAGTCGPPPALLQQCPPRGSGARWVGTQGVWRRGGKDSSGRVLGDGPAGDMHLRGTPCPPGERELPSIMAPPWGPGGHPGGAGGLRVAEPLLTVTHPGSELLAGCACCPCPVMVVSLGAEEVPGHTESIHRGQGRRGCRDHPRGV